MQTYSPSGKFNPLVIPLAMVAAALMAGIGYGYQWLMNINPLIYLSFLGTAAAGAGVFFVTLFALKFGKCRNTPLGIALGSVIGAVAVAATHYWNFQFAMAELAEMAQHEDIDMSEIQVTFAQFIDLKVEMGWSISGRASSSGAEITGLMVWLVWCIEALAFVGGGVYAGWQMREEPFCEGCERWADEDERVIFFDTPSNEMVVAAENATSIAEVMSVTRTGAPEQNLCLVYTFLGCDGGDIGGFLTVTYNEVAYDFEKDEEKTTEHVLWRNLILSRDDVVRLEALQAAADQPVADEDDEADDEERVEVA